MLVGAACSAAPAADLPASASAPAIPAEFLIYEWRLGAFAHDPGGPEGTGVDINGEVLFAKPWGTQAEWWLPRPHVGATVSLGDRTSIIYAGATWQFDFTPSLFAEATFGGSLNNARQVNALEARALGCDALFRESASLGYRLTDHWSVMATVEHNSNAGLCPPNRGLTNTGVRFGYRF